jgi:hypothetical protein
VDPIGRFEGALEVGSPATAVPELARGLRTEGMKQAPMCRLFSTELQRLSGDDPRYDAVADTMDLIWGGPWAKGAAR